jgi:hypothetical protein
MPVSAASFEKDSVAAVQILAASFDQLRLADGLFREFASVGFRNFCHGSGSVAATFLSLLSVNKATGRRSARDGIAMSLRLFSGHYKNKKPAFTAGFKDYSGTKD